MFASLKLLPNVRLYTKSVLYQFVAKFPKMSNSVTKIEAF